MPRECTTLLGADFSGKAQHGPARVTKPPPGRRSAGTPATRKTPWSIDKFLFWGLEEPDGTWAVWLWRPKGLFHPCHAEKGRSWRAQILQRTCDGRPKLPAWLFETLQTRTDTSHLLCQPIQQAFRACDNATMKFSAISLGLLALLTPLTAAWTKEGMFSVLFWALLQASHTRLPAPENTTFCPNTDQRHLSRQTTRSSAFATS